MRRHGTGHGTRMPRGVFSGVTLATIPSGVTMDSKGIDFPSFGPFDFMSAKVAWAGTTLTLAHGFTTLYHINATLINGTGSGASTAWTTRITELNPALGGVSCSIRTDSNAVLGSGGSVTWFAIGLV